MSMMRGTAMRTAAMVTALILTIAGAASAANVIWTGAAGNQDWWDGPNWKDFTSGTPLAPGTHPPRYEDYYFTNASLAMPTNSSGGAYTVDPGGGVVRNMLVTQPGNYALPFRLNYVLTIDAVAGATLTTVQPGVNNNTYTGLGKIAIRRTGQVAASHSIGGGTLDIRNTADTWLSGSYGGDWGNTLSGSGTVQCTEGWVVFSQISPHMNFKGVIDATISLYNEGTYNFTNCTIQKTIGANVLQSTTLASGKYVMGLCYGGASFATATVQNAAYKLNGQVIARRTNYNSSRFDTTTALATLAFDNSTLDVTNLNVTGNLAFTGAASKWTVSILGTGGLAGTDYSRLSAQRYQDDVGYSSVGGVISGLNNVDLVIRNPSGLSLPGQTLVIVTNAASLAGQSFKSVTWMDKTSGTPNYNANGTVTLTDVKVGGAAGTVVLLR